MSRIQTQATAFDCQLVETIVHVVLNIMNNSISEAFAVDGDFPILEAIRAA